MFFMRYKRWFLFLLLFFGGGICLLHHLKDGFWSFSIQKILPAALESPFEELFLHKDLLTQPFFYLGQGKHFYVFESLDKRYVLKLFKNKELQDPYLKKISFIPYVKTSIKNQMQFKRENRETLAKSLSLAKEYLPYESALLLLHLTPNKFLENNVDLFDKFGWQHSIDLNNTAFILQKKATLFPDLFSKLLEEGNFDKISELYLSINTLLKQCVSIGVVEKEHEKYFIHNIAFLEKESRAIVMDMKELVKTSQLPDFDKDAYIENRLATIMQWFKYNLPALYTYLKLSS